jgi:tetratricopeptide (TPR) repeat protein
MTSTAPKVLDASPGTPHRIAALVDRALAFAMDQRWQDAGAMQEVVRDAYFASTGGHDVAAVTIDAEQPPTLHSRGASEPESDAHLTIATTTGGTRDFEATSYTLTEAARTPRRVSENTAPEAPVDPPSTEREPLQSGVAFTQVDEMVEAFVRRGIARGGAGDHAGALEDFSRALALAPTCVEAYYNRALAEQHLGELPACLADYDKALELRPTFADAIYNRAIVKGRMGDVAGALADATSATLLYEREARQAAAMQAAELVTALGRAPRR